MDLKLRLRLKYGRLTLHVARRIAVWAEGGGRGTVAGSLATRDYVVEAIGYFGEQA